MGLVALPSAAAHPAAPPPFNTLLPTVCPPSGLLLLDIQR